VTLVFVYGTLMPGHVRWPVLAPFVACQPQRDRVRGLLVDTGAGYPGLVDVGCSRWVHGWRVELRPGNTDRALTTLDAVEGTAVGLYRRMEVMTANGMRCWTYEYLHGTPDLLDLNGRWPAGAR